MKVFKKLVAELLIGAMEAHRALLEAEAFAAKKLAGGGSGGGVKIETFEGHIADKIAHLDAEIAEQRAKIEALDAPVTFAEVGAELKQDATSLAGEAKTAIDSAVAKETATVLEDVAQKIEPAVPAAPADATEDKASSVAEQAHS